MILGVLGDYMYDLKTRKLYSKFQSLGNSTFCTPKHKKITEPFVNTIIVVLYKKKRSPH